MRHILLLLTAFVLISACKKPAQESKAPMMSEMDLQKLEAKTIRKNAGQTETGEKAPLEIKGEKVWVHNHICATSRSPLKEGMLGQFTSEVMYTGQDPKFKGKTFVFNQCCPMCAASFPEKWAKEQEDILRFHGVIARMN